MSEKFLIEQHQDNSERAHVYFYSPIPFPRKSSDEILGLEIRGLGEHGIAYCSPSVHQNGHCYEIIGTTSPIALTADQAKDLMQHIDNICKKQHVEYLDKYHRSLLDLNCKIYRGTRHDSLLNLANSLLFRFLGNGKSEQEIKAMLTEINNTRCVPSPLPVEEINRIWKDAVGYVKQRKQEEKREGDEDTDNNKSLSAAENALELFEEKCTELFTDQYGTPYAAVRIGNHVETLIE